MISQHIRYPPCLYNLFFIMFVGVALTTLGVMFDVLIDSWELPPDTVALWWIGIVVSIWSN